MTLGIQLNFTPAGSTIKTLVQRQPHVSKRRGADNIFDVREHRRSRDPRYTVILTFDKSGQPRTALCIDRNGEQCKANEFYSCCYHVTGALCRFYRMSPSALAVALNLTIPDSSPVTTTN